LTENEQGGEVANDRSGHGHHAMVAQPHTEDEGPIAEAERRAAKLRSAERPLGPRGRPVDWRSPFYVGLTGAAGGAVTYGALRGLAAVSSMLVLIGVALFVALGLEPAVSWLVNRGLPRWAAVTAALVLGFVIVAGSLAAAIPPLAAQARQFIDQAPHYIQQVQDHCSWIGRLNDRFHLQQRITETINGTGGSAVAEIVKRERRCSARWPTS